MKRAEFGDSHLKLKEVVKEGEKPMPAFGKKLTGEQIDDVIAYIRTFPKTTAQRLVCPQGEKDLRNIRRGSRWSRRGAFLKHSGNGVEHQYPRRMARSRSPSLS